MELVKYPDPILKKATVEIIDFGDELTRTVEDMLDIMYRYKGLGLAGPQAGLSRKIIVINPSGKQEDELVLVNPQVLDVAGEAAFEEGCLSFPGIYAKIDRPERIGCVARLPDGRKISFRCDGLLARIVLHEIDHLGGTLLVDRMSEDQRKAHQQDLQRLRKEYKA